MNLIMKPNLLKHLLCALLLTAFSTIRAPAVGLAYEGFDYVPGALLNGLNGGSGFAIQWGAESAVVVQSSGLSSSLSLPSMGYSIGGGFNAFRQLSAALNQPEFWVSFMIQANPGNDMVYLGLDDGSHLTMPAVSLGRLLDSCFIREGSTTKAQIAYAWAVGQTYLLVARFRQSGGVINVDLWIDPADFSGLPLLSAVLGGGGGPSYSWVSLQVQPGFLADEIRIGTAPGDVAGVTLGGTVTGGNLRLTWSHGTLLEAPTPSGSWHTNSAASSPYIVPVNSPQQFYRVVVQ
jgi:hypothetical protein